MTSFWWVAWAFQIPYLCGYSFCFGVGWCSGVAVIFQIKMLLQRDDTCSGTGTNGSFSLKRRTYYVNSVLHSGKMLWTIRRRHQIGWSSSKYFIYFHVKVAVWIDLLHSSLSRIWLWSEYYFLSLFVGHTEGLETSSYSFLSGRLI